MRPDTTQDMKVGWISIAVVAAICLLAYFIVSDGGKSAKAVESALRTYEKHKGEEQYPLMKEIRRQSEANEELARNIESLKNAVGIKPVRPFALPSNFTKQKGLYFRLVFDIAVEYLNDKARFKRVQEYSTSLGFEFRDGQIIEEDQAKEELIRLQLIVRAMLLALSTPDRLQEISIVQRKIVVTGPESRPPLLREYPFVLKVRGSLKDILWLMHQYSADTVPMDTVDDWNKLVTHVQSNMKRAIEPTTSKDHFPLILRGLKINSENSEPLDNVQQLEAEFELAGMEFLSDAERQAVKPSAGRRSRGGGSIQRF